MQVFLEEIDRLAAIERPWLDQQQYFSLNFLAPNLAEARLGGAALTCVRVQALASRAARLPAAPRNAVRDARRQRFRKLYHTATPSWNAGSAETETIQTSGSAGNVVSEQTGFGRRAPGVVLAW